MWNDLWQNLRRTPHNLITNRPAPKEIVASTKMWLWWGKLVESANFVIICNWKATPQNTIKFKDSLIIGRCALKIQICRNSVTAKLTLPKSIAKERVFSFLPFPFSRLHLPPSCFLFARKPTSSYSSVAQWKRAGPITQRSVDRHHSLLERFCPNLSWLSDIFAKMLFIFPALFCKKNLRLLFITFPF